MAATKYEVEPLLNHFDMKAYGDTGIFRNEGEIQIEVLITGVGMVNTAYYLGRCVHGLHNYVINAGICGAVNKNLNIGEVVNVTEDTLSEMGAENDTEFIKYEDLKLGGSNIYQNLVHTNSAALNQLKKVKGITVNTVHGNEESIKKVVSLYNPDVESMEGAAFFSGCKSVLENYFQIRAVSNYVEKRDRSKWNIPLAISNLNKTVINIIEEINA
ncbi:MAG: futalosine hydrolase [Bacteroidota bacterium]|nr:futalosine hydrolase [Bacteroidota bacterium]